MTENLERARLFQERVQTYLKAGLLHEGTHLKENWRTFSYILATLPIKDLYHVTTSYNVKSIFEHGGLIPYAKHQKEGISAHCIRCQEGSNADFVHLSFCPDKNSSNAIKQMKWPAVQLTIDPIAALLKGTTFRYGWDISTNQYCNGETTENLLEINFDAELQALTPYLQEQAKQNELEAEPQSDYRNAVILVPNKVPSFLIKDIKLL